MSDYGEEEIVDTPCKTRVICLADVDCFEVQVYEKILNINNNCPRVVAIPGSSRIVAANYPAKDLGIDRNVKVKEALNIFPKLKVIYKEIRWGKADTRTPRHASWKILDTIMEFCQTNTQGNIAVEYASSDEFFFDFTKEVDYRMEYKKKYCVKPLPDFHLEGATRKFITESLLFRLDNVYPTNDIYENEERLIYGGMIAQELCQYVQQKIGYKISAGVSSNKLLAKLACPIHKPGGVTVLPRSGLDRIKWRIKIEDIPGLGGRYGQMIKDKFQMKTLKEFRKIKLAKLKRKFGPENGSRFWDLGQGFSDDVVLHKTKKDEVSCSKSAIGHAYRNGDLDKYLSNLAGEMVERLEEEKKRHRRITNSLQIMCQYWKQNLGNLSSTFAISQPPNSARIEDAIYRILENDNRTKKPFAIKNLKLTAKYFVDVSVGAA